MGIVCPTTTHQPAPMRVLKHQRANEPTANIKETVMLIAVILTDDFHRSKSESRTRQRGGNTASTAGTFLGERLTFIMTYLPSSCFINSSTIMWMMPHMLFKLKVICTPAARKGGKRTRPVQARSIKSRKIYGTTSGGCVERSDLASSMQASDACPRAWSLQRSKPFADFYSGRSAGVMGYVRRRPRTQTNPHTITSTRYTAV